VLAGDVNVDRGLATDGVLGAAGEESTGDEIVDALVVAA
jgi:hypothetical protein